MSLFRQARFLKSAARLSELPVESLCEIAFAGRSNAGKSSVINALAGRRQLARASKTPGRTRLLNFFALGGGRFLVDLPGYGYARVARAQRLPWDRLIGEYLRVREPLAGLALVMDVRHPFTELDQALLDWFRPTGKPLHVILTKADKLSRSRSLQTLRDVTGKLASDSPSWSAQLFSSLNGNGLERAESVLGSWLWAPGCAATRCSQLGTERPGNRGKKIPG